jgi:hypothetical protein
VDTLLNEKIFTADPRRRAQTSTGVIDITPLKGAIISHRALRVTEIPFFLPAERAGRKKQYPYGE